MILKIFFIVSSLVRKLKQQAREQMEERRPNLVAALHQMGDFYMELKWDFQSWGKFLHALFLVFNCMISFIAKLRCLSQCMHLERWTTIRIFISMNMISIVLFILSVPLVSRVLPSDICKIHKSGASIRMDTTLVDFNDMRWERGDISFIFNGDQKPSHSLTVLDNKAKLFQRVRYEVNSLFKFICFLYVYVFLHV